MRSLEVPNYEIWGLLGEGGMSEVWLGKHIALAAPVVVKTLRRALAVDGTQAAAARILSEARLMARVQSPQIVHAIDAGQVPGVGTPYLVQEYVDGLDLNELDRRRRASLGIGLPLWLVCHVMREVSSGLRAAHHAGVVHRDLKPSNVFGTQGGWVGERAGGIRLGDFGIAVARSDAPPTDTAGTLAFMAPEQFEGGAIGRFTDVWGAGATACDLRYGHPPFDSVGAIVDRKRAPDLPPPLSPPEAYFQQVVRCMLEKDVDRRPRDLSAPLYHFAMLTRALEPPSPQATRIDETRLRVGPLDLTFIVGDIATAKADAIVSSANYRLEMRTGVGEALRKKGGDDIEREAQKEGEQPLGSCLRTKAGKLESHHVFHAVSAWNEVSCVGRSFARALLLSEEHGCMSLAAPALGTGAARVGLEMCAHAMMTTLRWHMMLGGTRLRDVTIWLDSDVKRRAFQDVAEEVFGFGDTLGLGTHDLGLPVEGGILPSPEAATFLDPRLLSTQRR